MNRLETTGRLPRQLRGDHARRVCGSSCQSISWPAARKSTLRVWRRLCLDPVRGAHHLLNIQIVENADNAEEEGLTEEVDNKSALWVQRVEGSLLRDSRHRFLAIADPTSYTLSLFLHPTPNI